MPFICQNFQRFIKVSHGFTNCHPPITHCYRSSRQDAFQVDLVVLALGKDLALVASKERCHPLWLHRVHCVALWSWDQCPQLDQDAIGHSGLKIGMNRFEITPCPKRALGRGTFLSSFGASILYHILCILIVSSPADVSVDLTGWRSCMEKGWVEAEVGCQWCQWFEDVSGQKSMVPTGTLCLACVCMYMCMCIWVKYPPNWRSHQLKHRYGEEGFMPNDVTWTYNGHENHFAPSFQIFLGRLCHKIGFHPPL